jgi:hypothetical protein
MSTTDEVYTPEPLDLGQQSPEQLAELFVIGSDDLRQNIADRADRRR